MSAPPETIELRYCPVCGKHDRHSDLRKGTGRHFKPYGQGKCNGMPIDLTYRLETGSAAFAERARTLQAKRTSTIGGETR